MNEYLGLIEIFLLLIIIFQLGCLIWIVLRKKASGSPNSPGGGQTVNFNIGQDGSIEYGQNKLAEDKIVTKESPSEKKTEVDKIQKDNNSKTIEDEEEEEEEEEERDPGAPSEEAVLRAEEHDRLAEELRLKNEQKEYDKDRNSKAAENPSSGSGIKKCSNCGVENTAMRLNCFNCGEKL